MADLVFRSTTRGGRDFFEVTDDGMAYGGKDRYNIKTDDSMNFADTVDEVLAELVFDGAWRINYDKIEVDELGIGDEYKEIVKLIRKKYNWLYNLPKGSKGRQFYFDIGRYFRQELKKGTDYGKIFDKIDGVIEKNNNFEESKEMDRKSIKEYRGTIDELIDNWASYKEKNDYYIHMYGVKNFDNINGKGIPLYEAHFRYNSKGTSLVETEVKFGYADYVTNMTDSTCQKLLAEIIARWNEEKENVVFRINDVQQPLDYPDIPKQVFWRFATIVAEVLDVPNQKILKQYKEGKTMKKNRMTERFDAPKDWDFGEMVEDYGEEYLNEVGSDWEDYVHTMDDLEYYLEKEDLNWLLNRIYFGGQYINGDFNTKETFDPNEEYYVVNGYGNFYSLSEYYKNDFIKDKIEELNDGEESFYDWCIEEGYFESEDEE